jgi:hypothetical protein
MEPSLALSCVKLELICNGSEAVSASAGIDVMSDVATFYLCPQSMLLAVPVETAVQFGVISGVVVPQSRSSCEKKLSSA